MLSSRSTMTVAISAGVLAAAVVMAVVAPGATAFFSDGVPRAYSALRAWLTPPYLYFVINVIIISIAVSSHFLNSSSDDHPPPPPAVRPDIITPADYAISKLDPTKEEPPQPIFVVEEVQESPLEPAAPPPAAEEEEFVISSSLPQEKPLVSARFGRRGTKASPDGKTLRVSRPKKGETLESTWKTITDGRAVPLARHLKKSDTWGAAAEQHGRGGRQDESPVVAAPVARKSETFKGGRSSPSPSPSSGRLRKEASLGQDDLNRRVEAFINKFNEEMRLQRQESYQHYLQMIDSSRGRRL